MSDKPTKDITSWPPKEPVAQLDRDTLRRMTPEAINQARKAGALDDLLSGKPRPAPPANPVIQKIIDDLTRPK